MLRHRGKTGLEANILATASASASTSWPRPRAFDLALASVLLTWSRKCAIQCNIILIVSISWLYNCNIHYKDVIKHSNVGHKFSYVFLELSPCVLIQKYLHVPGLDLDIGLEDLASASTLWRRLTSLPHTHIHTHTVTK